ncbi:hypothetical protein J7K50_08830 [bacterium]|nr:hypothetical protein [bacterium]
MTDYWVDDGDVGIRPNVDRNIVPPSNEAINKDVGETGDRWENAYVENLDASKSAVINSEGEGHADRFFGVKGDEGEQDADFLIYASSNLNRIYLGTSTIPAVSTDARTVMTQEGETAAISVVSFKQRDEDMAFLDFEGAIDSDCSKNISTGNGNGIVDGPKTRSGEGIGWNFARMIKIRINEATGWKEYWIPAFTCDTGH